MTLLKKLYAGILARMRRLAIVKEFCYRNKYPGAGVHTSANLDIQGKFKYTLPISIGEGVNIIVPNGAELICEGNIYIGRYVEIGPTHQIKIGRNTSIQDRSLFIGDVEIGENCLISLNVYASSGHHFYDFYPQWLIRDQDEFVRNQSKEQDVLNRPVKIEDDCWIGINVVILPGVVVGKGAIIGANSVVRRNVDPYTVVAGVPAKLIKERLSFKPPRRLLYSNLSDLPYFYCGFKNSQEELRASKKMDGIFAASCFTLAMDASGGASLHMLIKSTLQSSCLLALGGKVVKVSNDYSEIQFPLALQDCEKSRFHFESSNSGEKFLIKEAWIQ